jgi:NADH-quinone oxidoreductase subunit F
MAAKERRLILDQCNIPGINTFAVARENGYYDTWEKIVKEMTPDEVTDQVTQSGLQGRGGAWFSAGMKWSFMPKEPDPEKYSILAVNCDESEPGTCKDRYLLETNPHMLIEGILASAFAIRARVAYVYIRGEMWEGLEQLDAALKDVYAAGLAGKNILGTGVDIDVYTQPGAGAYICGEETALMESTEGKRGYPRNKPPFPAAHGIFGHPTTINNIGTLGYVPWIIKNGPESFKEIGDPNFPGTLIYQVSGHVEKPGLYETEINVTLRELIDLAGGVRDGRGVKGVIPGGSSMPILTPDELDVVMSPASFMPRGEIKSGLGSAAIIVFDDTTDIVDVAHNLMTFYRHESCGQCTPCREGAKWAWDLINRLGNRQARPGDVELIEEILVNVGDIDKFETNKTICLFGVSFGWPLTMMIRKYREDFLKAEQESTAPPLPRPTPLPIIAAGHLS